VLLDVLVFPPEPVDVPLDPALPPLPAVADVPAVPPLLPLPPAPPFCVVFVSDELQARAIEADRTNVPRPRRGFIICTSL
jgi:hypothetical protein